MFAQCQKRLDKDKNPFAEYVLMKAEPQWGSLTVAQKNSWREIAKEFKGTEVYQSLRETHKEIQKADSEDWRDVYKLTFGMMIILMVRWVLFCH